MMNVIQRAEKLYYLEHDAWRSFGKKQYIFTPSVENDLGIYIPKNDEAYCEYSFYVQGTTVQKVEVYTKDTPNGHTGWLCGYSVNYYNNPVLIDKIIKSSSHPWGKYIMADRYFP